MPEPLSEATLRIQVEMASDPMLRSMAAELLALRDFIDRYRKTWTGAHSDYRRRDEAGLGSGPNKTPGCLICEADRLLGGETR